MRIKNIEDLRQVFADQIEGLTNGKTTPQTSRGVVQAGRAIIDSIRVELQYNRLIGRTPAIPFIKVGKALPDETR